MIRDDPETVTVFLDRDEDLAGDRFLGMHSGHLVFLSPECSNALLERDDRYDSMDGHDISLLRKQDSSMPAMAPHNTLAGQILRNLAYAPEEDRLDLLLQQDAERKAELLKRFAADRAADYKKTISRIEK